MFVYGNENVLLEFKHCSTTLAGIKTGNIFVTVYSDINKMRADMPPVPKKPPVPFVIPKRNDNMRRVYAYLINRRGIDRDVLYSFAHKGMIYESADYHNAVFVGFDKNGIVRHAHKRGGGSQSTFKGNRYGGQNQQMAEKHEPIASNTKNADKRRSGGSSVQTAPRNRRMHQPPASQESEVKSDGQA